MDFTIFLAHQMSSNIYQSFPSGQGTRYLGPGPERKNLAQLSISQKIAFIM
jgi:hypothetical protein